MSNRRKLKKQPLGLRQSDLETTLIKRSALSRVNVPAQERVVLKKVPANIKWAEVGGIDRDDVEIIGEAIIYEDGTSQMIVNDDISDDAKKLLGSFYPNKYSLAEQEEGNGIPGQE